MFGSSDPSKSSMKYLKQIPSTITPYYSPYINAGNSALSSLQNQSSQLTGLLPSLQSQYASLVGMGPTVQNQYMKLIQDPTSVMNQIGSGYQQSPGYQYQVDQATNAANRSAAAGGMMGSPEEQAYLASNVNNLANQDYYNYVNQGLNQYNQGLQGASGLYGMGLSGQQGLYNTGLDVTQDINHMGYNASNELAQSLANNLSSMANLKYAGAANQNMGNSGLYGGLLGLGGQLGSAALFSGYF